MIKFFFHILIIFILSMIEAMIISPLPTGPIASVFAYFYELSYVVIIIFAISSSLGFTAIQYLLRRINYQPKNLKILKKVERWQGRVTILIENFGYFIVLVMTATTLVLPLSISFLFHKNINYFKYFFYSLIGKILIFTVYFQMFRVTNLNYQIIGFYSLCYITLLIILIYIVKTNDNVFKKIMSYESDLEDDLFIKFTKKFIKE